MLSKFKFFVFFGLFFTFAFTWFTSVTENELLFRDVASVENRTFQLTSLNSAQIKSHLQKNLKVGPTQNGIKDISFNGFAASLCKIYSSVEMEFTAEGVAVAGETPVMKISAPCASGNSGEMASLHLPIEKILHEKPHDAAYSYDGFNSTVSFKNSADEWPRQWVLKKVEFKNISGADNKTVLFNRAPASEGERPIVLEF